MIRNSVVGMLLSSAICLGSGTEAGVCGPSLAGLSIFRASLVDALEFEHLSALEDPSPDAQEIRAFQAFNFALINSQLCLRGLTVQNGIGVDFSISDKGREALHEVRRFYQALWDLTEKKKSMMRHDWEAVRYPTVSHREAIIMALLNRDAFVSESDLSAQMVSLTAQYSSSDLNELKHNELVFAGTGDTVQYSLTILGEKTLASLFRFYGVNRE